MKYYETTFDEYIASVEKYNFHPEMAEIVTNTFPKHLREFGNLIVYGPSGIGKYSQVLHFLQKYSPTKLKHEKYMTIQTDKQTYTYCMSDIHYEIDISFLGCNSKLLWHELFFQIVDIVCTRPEKTGIIVCKNFHTIHGELLDVFYSYIQQFSKSVTTHFGTNITIFFILITENISFLPNNILNSCQIINVRRPTKQQYTEMLQNNMNPIYFDKTTAILDMVDCHEIINIKELYSFHKIIINPNLLKA
jgi:Cdc6-like AAA superfamily ATPase